MKKLTACLSAILLVGLLAAPAAFAAPPASPANSPTEPGNPTTPPSLPDPNDPDSPDEVIIEEDGVPKTYKKIWDPETEEYVYVLDEDVPLSNRTSPQTGVDGLSDSALLAVTAAVLGVSGAAALKKAKKFER